jgi:hypothetical protein
MALQQCGIGILFCCLLVGCTDHSRECSLYMAVIDVDANPVAGLTIEIAPSAPVYPMQSIYKVSTGADGKTVLKYTQLWANRSVPPDIKWTILPGIKSVIMRQNAEGYFVITRKATDVSARSVTEQEFKRLHDNRNAGVSPQ